MTAPSSPEGGVQGWVSSVLAQEEMPALLRLLPELGQDLSEIEEHIQASLPTSYPFLGEAAAFATATGGKRLRALLMAVAFRALGSPETTTIQPLAAAIQLIHTATLVHDDVIDHAELRRGKPSVLRAFGTPAAIVAGDYLFVRAFQLAARYTPAIILRCGEACAELAQGEMMQENSRFDLTLGRERYLKIVNLKTASIVSAGLACMGMVHDEPGARVEALAQYGDAVGTAFQIQDDLLDIYGDPDETGKPLFSDFREGIPTLLSLDAYARLDGRERSEFERLFTARRKRPAELLRLKELTEVAGARALTETEAMRQVDRGVRALQELPGGPYRDLLERIARGVISRTY